MESLQYAGSCISGIERFSSLIWSWISLSELYNFVNCRCLFDLRIANLHIHSLFIMQNTMAVGNMLREKGGYVLCPLFRVFVCRKKPIQDVWGGGHINAKYIYPCILIHTFHNEAQIFKSILNRLLIPHTYYMSKK